MPENRAKDKIEYDRELSFYSLVRIEKFKAKTQSHNKIIIMRGRSYDMQQVLPILALGGYEDLYVHMIQRFSQLLHIYMFSSLGKVNDNPQSAGQDSLVGNGSLY